MPPKTKFNKEDIISAAFDIAKNEGFSAITARSVGKYLGCSVAPIYVNFENIEELVEAVVLQVFAMSNEMVANQGGQDVFEKIGKASLQFAREYPVFFRELVLKPNKFMTGYETIEKSMLEAMAADESLGNLTQEQRKRLFFKMRVFQLGLSTMLANGHIPAWLDEKEAEKLLMEVGEELLNIQVIKQGEKKL